jgi:hypothetical protein
MRSIVTVATPLAVAALLAACQSLPPGAERGPNGTMAYSVVIEASEPGARIEANGEVLGNTPLTLKVFGDPDGTFHDFGSDFYGIRALPLTTNQYAQTRLFGTGRWFGPEDRIPERIYFDMNQPPPPQPTYAPGGPVYVYPGYGPYYPYYYGPYYYGGPYYWGHYHYYGGYGGHYHGSGGLRYYQRPSSAPARPQSSGSGGSR